MDNFNLSELFRSKLCESYTVVRKTSCCPELHSIDWFSYFVKQVVLISKKLSEETKTGEEAETFVLATVTIHISVIDKSW